MELKTRKVPDWTAPVSSNVKAMDHFILVTTYSDPLLHPVAIVELNFDNLRDLILELEAAMSRRQWSVLFFGNLRRRCR